MNGSLFAPTNVDQFTTLSVSMNAQGVTGTATAGATTNIDLKITDDSFITGGQLITHGAAFGDHASLQVVDVDGVFATAGTVLGQYVTNWYMAESDDIQVKLEDDCPAKLPAGVYLRVAYTSVGSTPVQVAMNYILHLALY